MDRNNWRQTALGGRILKMATFEENKFKQPIYFWAIWLDRVCQAQKSNIMFELIFNYNNQLNQENYLMNRLKQTRASSGPGF